MNARQKAKKYKKMAERYKDKAEAYDILQRTEAYKNMLRRGYGTIETLKVVKWWDDRYPVDEGWTKKQIAIDFADCLLRDGYIDFKVENEYNEYTMARKITATLNVTKGGWNDDNH